MNVIEVQNGSQIADDLPLPSLAPESSLKAPETVDDLLKAWEVNPPREIAVLKTTCSLLAEYLDTLLENLSLDAVNDMRAGFRPFLFGRRYKENSVRTYVNHLQILLKDAQRNGWVPNDNLPRSWRSLVEKATEQNCDALVRYMAKTGRAPEDVTTQHVDEWALEMGRQGRAYKDAKVRGTRFISLLRDSGYELELPARFYRQVRYGISVKDFPAELRTEVQELLRWKQALFALDRPKNAKLRPVSARMLQSNIEGLYGFATNVARIGNIAKLSELVRKSVVGAFAEWAMNERKVKGDNLRRNLSSILAAMGQYPAYKDLDLEWFKPLIDSLPRSTQTERRERKEQKYLDYAVIESIPAQIRVLRQRVEGKNKRKAAAMATEELLMKWISVLPWRQRNIRECRVNGSNPNLFKAPISRLSQIQKPDWVRAAEQKDPNASFWQFRFSSEETKTGIEIHALVPRQLIDLLEEYIGTYRKYLMRGVDPGTLLLNRRGKAFSGSNIEHMVARLTLRFGGRRVTPHAFRDIIAFTWLEQHPADYLTLSKMLWHSNINTTIQIYGSRFNESSGVRAMEAWLDERSRESS
jgi:hypothetical protein